MIELFTNISEQKRKQAELLFNLAIQQKNIIKISELLHEFTQNILDDEERDFFNFYFNMRMEQLKNGNSNDQR